MTLTQEISDLVGGAETAAPGEALELLSGIAQVGQALVDSALAPGGPWASEEDRVALVQGAQTAVGAIHAAQTAWIARFAGLTIVDNDTTGFEQVDRGVGFVDEFASDTLAPMLGMSHGAASTKVVRAAKLAADLPVTLAALAAGELDIFRAQCIAEELADADHDVCAVVEQMVHPKITGDTPMKARNRVRRALAEIDPELVRERAARAKLDRFVSTRASHLPGLTEWYAQLPAEDSAKAWAAIDALAHQKLNDDPTKTLSQHRADALVDLILGNATIEAHVTIAIPITGEASAAEATDSADVTGGADAGDVAGGADAAGAADIAGGADAAGGAGTSETSTPRTGAALGVTGEAGATGELEPGTLDELWAILSPHAPTGTGVEIPGIGVIPAPLALTLAASLGARVTRMLVDPETGTTVETSATSYRPSAAIARHVRLRDGTCRFPNCARRAERCEIDHVVPWPGGPTSVANLLCLCKHHHRLKHSTRWRPILQRDGTVIWTSPYGEEFITRPIDHRELAIA